MYTVSEIVEIGRAQDAILGQKGSPRTDDQVYSVLIEEFDE